MSDITITLCILITIISWYSFLYIKESIVVDPLSRFSSNDFNEFFVPEEECDYSTRKSPIIVRISYAVTIVLAGIGASCLYRIKQCLIGLQDKQGMYCWLLNEFRTLQDEMKVRARESDKFSSEKLIKVKIFNQGHTCTENFDPISGGDNLQAITGIISHPQPLSSLTKRQITIQEGAGNKIIHNIKVNVVQTMSFGMKMAASGYYRCRTSVATVMDSENLKSTVQNLLAQISVGSDKSRQGWNRFVKSVKLMTKSFVILLVIEFSCEGGGNGDSTSDSNNHDPVNTLSPLIMNNKNRGDTEGGLEENGSKFYIKLDKHEMDNGMSVTETDDEVVTNVAAAGDGTDLGNSTGTITNRVNVKSIGSVNLIQSLMKMKRMKVTTTNVPKTLTSAPTMATVQLLDTRQILNMKRQLPLNHRCSCRNQSCWLCSGCRSTSNSGDDDVGEQEKCYQVKLSYVDKRIVCVNTPTLQQMKSLKLY